MQTTERQTMQVVIPFPSARRAGLIRKLARLMASCKPDAAERVLDAQLRRQHESMLRKGLPREIVERELRTLEHAVRAELWSITLYGGDAA